MSPSEATNPTRSLTQWVCALARATSRASRLMSTANTRSPGISAASVTAMAPLPVP